MAIFALDKARYYHPIKVVFLDDNKTFLDSLELEFGSQINMITCTNHLEALNSINYPMEATESFYPIENYNKSLDINELLKVLYNDKRFDQVPILVVDYEMPDINGLEFCKKIKNKKIFKIMLTAEADKNTAINAFNEGLIDKFILKTNKNLLQELKDSINELTERYFKEKTEELFFNRNKPYQNIFEVSDYKNLFNKLLLQTQAVEFYAIDNYGSFLFLNEDANPTWLVIRDNKELEEQLDLLYGYEVPDQMISKLFNKEKMLFLFSELEYKKPINQWVNYFFDIKKLSNNYYYCIIENQLTDVIRWAKIFPYSSYKQKQYNLII